jgi:D-glycero-D-manno-heptose 1,7-bisphosphate phosphatase
LPDKHPPASKAIFLDRDGTILKEITGSVPGSPASLGYVTQVKEVELIEHSADAIALAGKLGYKIIVITNQSAIARGWLTIEQLHAINERMYDLLAKANPDAVIDDLFYSPYHIDGVIDEYKKESETRKPDIGMIIKAKEKHNIDLSGSYMVGDAYTDMQCGINAGIKNILVMTGCGKMAYKKCLDEKLKIDFIADNLFEAVKFIEKNDE